MTLLNNILIDDEVLSSKFLCDLKRCKGACCTFEGDRGAPLLDEEVSEMQKNLDAAMQYLSQRNINYIEKHGFEEGSPGNKATVCISRRDCVFVFYEDDIAKCAFEKAYFNGESDFRKPVSCHLFPIRHSRYENNYIYYCVIDECKPGRKLGSDTNTALIESLREALIRKFGEDFYKLLVKSIK
jgi:hypothetical protein